MEDKNVTNGAEEAQSPVNGATDNSGDADRRDDELLEQFRRVARLMARKAHGGDHGGHAQRRVLGILREEGATSQRELMERFGVRSSTLSEVLGKLERNGLIVREVDENDRRGYVIRMSDRAVEVDAEAGKPPFAASEDYFACLDAEERRSLKGILQKIAEGLGEGEDEESEDGRPHGRGRGGRGGRCGRGGLGGRGNHGDHGGQEGHGNLGGHGEHEGRKSGPGGREGRDHGMGRGHGGGKEKGRKAGRGRQSS